MNASGIRKGASQLLAPPPELEALDVSDLRAYDLVVIRTRNSLYRFVVTSDRDRRGRLSGDFHRRLYPEAVFVGTLVRLGERLHTFSTHLRTQAHALFHLHEGGEVLQLVTSAIVSLCCFRHSDEAALEFDR